jgi:hypothetical protein
MFWFMARDADANWKKSPNVRGGPVEGKAEGGRRAAGLHGSIRTASFS